MAVLLDKLIAKLVKSCSGLLVSCLHLQKEAERERPLAGGANSPHLFLQTDSDDGGSLAAVQRWPVSHVSPGRHWELTAVLVAHDLLLPGQTNRDYWKCNRNH